MPEMELLVGPRSKSDGDTTKGRAGYYGELLDGSINGFFAEQVARGNGYSFSTALAGNALVAATTSNAPAIWNPPESGRVLYLQCVKYGRTAKGTPLEGSIVYNRLQNVRSFGATGNDIVSGTAVAALNLRSDKGDDSKMLFYPTTIVTTATPVLWAEAGVAQTAEGGAAAVVGPHAESINDWIWGMLQLWPSTLLSLGAAVALSTTYGITIFALSLPIPKQP